MDKTKASIIITGLMMCAMSYANMSTARGELRLPETDTLALALVRVDALAAISPAEMRRGGRTDAASGNEAAAGSPARAVPNQGAEQQFDIYLRLHQSRVETAPAAASQFATSH